MRTYMHAYVTFECTYVHACIIRVHSGSGRTTQVECQERAGTCNQTAEMAAGKVQRRSASEGAKSLRPSDKLRPKLAGDVPVRSDLGARKWIGLITEGRRTAYGPRGDSGAEFSWFLCSFIDRKAPSCIVFGDGGSAAASGLPARGAPRRRQAKAWTTRTAVPAGPC
mmetsp:Transcript_56917/g.149954  ORF Transcript_56917/g.149954 Transcript_56917/m.149954 type:complete len:167 (+) Transcript_56917:51-551(+)